ncbi:MAG: recombinase family protein [Flavipsychrobacter sp.]
MRKAVAYYRVSTERQGHSGLGLEAQKKSVTDFIKVNDYLLDKEFIEIESGKKASRPILAKALRRCKATNATLLIAKLDRLARNVKFISTLMESRVDFKAVDNPYAEDLIIHIMAAFAQHERVQISKRTTAALRAAKARGVKLGKHGRDVLSKKNHREADCFAEKMKPIIEQIQTNGIRTIRGITGELNRLKVTTYRNKKWHPNTVHNLIKRIKRLNIKN